jgi:hypothetical protein
MVLESVVEYCDRTNVYKNVQLIENDIIIENIHIVNNLRIDI